LSAGKRRTIGVDVEDALCKSVVANTVVDAAHGRQDLDVPVVLFFIIERQIVADFEKNSVNFIFGLGRLLMELGVDIFEKGINSEGKGVWAKIQGVRSDRRSFVASGDAGGTFDRSTDGSGIIIDLDTGNTRGRAWGRQWWRLSWFWKWLWNWSNDFNNGKWRGRFREKRQWILDWNKVDMGE